MKKVSLKEFKALTETVEPHIVSAWCGDIIAGEKAAALKIAVLFGQNKIRVSRAVKAAVEKNGYKLHSIRKGEV